MIPEPQKYYYYFSLKASIIKSLNLGPNIVKLEEREDMTVFKFNEIVFEELMFEIKCILIRQAERKMIRSQ